jgi:hypothetical protein
MIFVAVVTVICLVAASVAAVASGVSGSAVAFSVNGTKVSQATVDRELDWLAGNKSVAANVEQQGQTLSASEGSINSVVTASWLNQRIQTELLRQAAEERGVSVPAATRTQLAQQAEDRYPNAPESARRAIVDFNAYLTALEVTSAEQQSEVVAAAARGADIRVDPRYGRWSRTQGVCPPAGCSTTIGG